MDFENVLILIQKELRDALRNRWFLLYAVAFAGLSLALAWFSVSGAGSYGVAGFGRTTAGLINLGYAYSLKKEHAKAVKALQGALPNEDTSEVRLMLGMALFDGGKQKEAVPHPVSYTHLDVYKRQALAWSSY